MATLVAQPHFIFGVRAGVRNNLCFLDEQTVVFPAGNNCVCHNTILKYQSFIPGRLRDMLKHFQVLLKPIWLIICLNFAKETKTMV